MKDELFRVAVMAFALALVTPGCGDGEDLPPVDLGPEDDMNVPVDLDLDRDMGPPPCDGPPGLYVEGSCTELAAGVRPFRPRFQLWSDAAEKERFVFIPENGVIDTSDPDRWVFPVGTVFWKTFSRGGVRLETRILTKVAAGEGMDSWTFQTYGWNQTQDDVTLVGVDGLSNVLGTTHDIPSREDCLACHAAATRDVGLGFDAIQLADMNLPLTLDDLAAAGEMSANITMASAATPGTTVQRNALGYLHANCAHCHGGSSPQVGLNMQLVTGLTGVCETNTYLTALDAADDMAGGCTTPGRDSFWGTMDTLRVAPNSLANSAVYQRMSVRTAGNQMPPVGTEDPDTLGLMTIQNWIMGGVPHVP
ncbi:MAG: hypothetical protein IPG81_13335 [Sandaracinaceae bacterium]|nr:hypothetical protein [Sandaracinaceae bacterium]